MRTTGLAGWSLGVAFAALAWLSSPDRAAAQVPLGSQFQVNTYTPNLQDRPNVAALANGDFVVVWESYVTSNRDGGAYSIEGQRFASDGTALGSEFQVDTETIYNQTPVVAAGASGDFVVVWSSYGTAGGDNSNWGIHARRYASDGTALSSEFQVNTYTTGYQVQPAVAARADGGFVVVWESAGSYGTDTSNSSVQGQRYASDGTAEGSEFQVNSYTTGGQSVPAVASTAAGDFVVTWASPGPGDPFSDSVQAQRFASNGVAQGGQFQVNTYTTGIQFASAIAELPSGDFVVAWESKGSSGGDTSFWSIQGRRYASDGTALGDQFQVNTFTTGYQRGPSVAAVNGSDFVVVWSNLGAYDVRARRYSSDGVAHGSEFHVGYGDGASLASLSNGNFVVGWTGDGSYYGTDDSSSSIQAQRYLPEPDATLALGAGIALLASLWRRRR